MNWGLGLIETSEGMVCLEPITSLIVSIFCWIGLISVLMWLYRFRNGEKQ